MTSIPSCPSCETPLIRDSVCECGLDPTLIFDVMLAASGLAHQAARAAAEGAWAKAATSAAESLRLRYHDNDLAAFIVLLSCLADPSVQRPERVPLPRVDRLPECLADQAGEVIDLVGMFHELSHRADVRDEEFTRRVEDLAPQFMALGWIDDTQEPNESSVIGRRPAWVFLAPVACFFLGAALMAVMRPEPPAAQEPASTASPVVLPAEQSPDQDHARELESLKKALAEANEEVEATRIRADVLRAVVAGNWDDAANSLDAIPKASRPAFVRSTIPSSEARSLYLAGLKASRKEAYRDASLLLEAALTLAPDDAYYGDDCEYYLARAAHRHGDIEQAIAGYEEVLALSPPSPYRADSLRFLLMISRRDRESEVDE